VVGELPDAGLNESWTPKEPAALRFCDSTTRIMILEGSMFNNAAISSMKLVSLKEEIFPLRTIITTTVGWKPVVAVVACPVVATPELACPVVACMVVTRAVVACAVVA
jgi:hypothetical protein